MDKYLIYNILLKKQSVRDRLILLSKSNLIHLEVYKTLLKELNNCNDLLKEERKRVMNG